MTTSQTAFMSEVTSEFAVLALETRAYLQERLRNRLYDLVIGEFQKHQDKNPAFTKAALARRIESRPEFICEIATGAAVAIQADDPLVGTGRCQDHGGMSPEV